MGVYKAKEGKTKDGRIWFFKLRYQDMDGRNKQYKSGKYATKKEAEEAELEFRLKIHKHENMDKITIDEMIDLFVENRTSTIEVKPTTLYNYGNKKNYLKCLLSIISSDFSIILAVLFNKLLFPLILPSLNICKLESCSIG